MKHILLVENEEIDRSVLGTHLRGLRPVADVRFAVTFNEGMSMLKEGGPWDLLVTDLALQGDKDTYGLALVSEARFRSVPVVVTSSYLTVPLTRQLFKMGADDVFEKCGLDEVDFKRTAGGLVRRARPALPDEFAEVTLAGRRALRRLFPEGSRHVMAVLFTDIVGSTDLNERLGDEMMARIRKRHFDRGDRCLKINRGRRVKTIGDSIMAVFPTPSDALDFAIMFRADTGDENVRVRAGFHVGPVLIEGGDTFGSTVNYAARVTSQAQGPDIIVSNEAYKQIKSHKSQAHASIQWLKHSAMKLKGFKGKRLLWSIRDEEAAIPRKPSKRV